MPFAPYPDTFGPAAGYIHRGQGGEIEALTALTTVGHQVSLEEARTVLLPVSKGADRDGAFEQTPGLGSGKGMASSQPPIRTQQPVNGGWAYLAKLVLQASVDSQLTMLSHHLDQLTKKWFETLVTQSIAGLPYLPQRIHYLVSVATPTPSSPSLPR